MATRPSHISASKPAPAGRPAVVARRARRVLTENGVRVRSRVARASDTPAIHRLIATFAAQGVLLPRSLENITECISHFVVMEKDGEIIGCVALEPYGMDLAEVRSLAVAGGHEGHGLGARLLRFALAIAKRRKVARAFAVTHAPEFFTHQGFTVTERQAIPEKIERDCNSCPKQRDCHLTAVMFAVLPERTLLPVLV